MMQPAYSEVHRLGIEVSMADWREVLCITDGPRNINGMAVEAWREQVWLLLRTPPARDLHREVFCGRLGLREAERLLAERGIGVNPPEPKRLPRG